MAEPHALPNETQGALTSEFVHGTDDHLHLVAIGYFDAGGGKIRVSTTDGDHWALYIHTGISTNDLTGLTQVGLAGLLETDAAYTFPAGAIVERVLCGEDVASRIMGPASATDGHFFKADGTSGKLAKAETIAVADLGTFVTQAATTLYVAKTGNDGNAGTSGAPKLTIGGALDALPVVLAHACTINVAPGEYDEILTTKLSRFIIPASLTIEAKDTADRVWHVRGQATAGANTTIDVEAAHVLVDDEWNGAYIMLWKDTAVAPPYASGQIRAITDSDESDNRLTVATWETNPANTCYYILTGAVIVDGTTASPVECSGLRNVTFKGIRFTVSGAADIAFEVSGLSSVVLEDCIATSGDLYGYYISYLSSATMNYCGTVIAANKYGFVCGSSSSMGVFGCVAYGAKSGDFGFMSTQGAVIAGSGSYPCFARHCGTGTYAITGGLIVGTMSYTDNTANANPDTPTTTAELVADGMAFIQDNT